MLYVVGRRGAPSWLVLRLVVMQESLLERFERGMLDVDAVLMMLDESAVDGAVRACGASLLGYGR